MSGETPRPLSDNRAVYAGDDGEKEYELQDLKHHIHKILAVLFRAGIVAAVATAALVYVPPSWLARKLWHLWRRGLW